MQTSAKLRHTIRSPRRQGFSLIELTIVIVIIGIIAAIAIPKLSQGSSAAADSAVAQNLANFRQALDLYQTEHAGTYPSGTTPQVVSLLTGYSDSSGTNTSATKDTGPNQIIYGPYMRSIPAISVGTNVGATGIAVSNQSGVDATAAGDTGWLYNSVDGTIAPYTGAKTLDSAGRPYSSY